MSATRYNTKEKASLEIYGRGGNFIAEIKNLSTTGACIEWTDSEVALQEGDLLRMTVLLKALNRKHNLNAEVIWRKGRKSGITFLKSDQIFEKIVERDS